MIIQIILLTLTMLQGNGGHEGEDLFRIVRVAFGGRCPLLSLHIECPLLKCPPMAA